MSIRGRVANGVVVPDEPGKLPEGAIVRVDVINDTAIQHQHAGKQPRRGRFWKGQVTIADDFDDLPEDMAEAFGVNES